MREGIQDKVLSKVLHIHSLAVRKIKSSAKGQKPFAAKPVNPDELIYALETLGYDDPMTLVREYGEAPINKLFYEISMMKQRRMKSGSIQENTQNTSPSLPPQLSESVQADVYQPFQASHKRSFSQAQSPQKPMGADMRRY